VRLTVSDFARSLRFYTEVLGFTISRQFNETSALLHDGTMGLGINTPWHEISAAEQRFDEARVGLDHLAFRVASTAEVEQAAQHLDEHGIAHSEVKPGRLPGSCLVVFRDPDNVQLEYYYSP
jgi:catechol 2,3-dioxygenase-like lactoylglutathione lyase family enzyme